MSGFNSLLKIFVPKNAVFFELFEKVAENLTIMGTQLKAVVAETDVDKRAKLIAVIEDLEHQNDDLTHSLFTELGRNFITPFDREDIHYLATSLDDIADYIYGSAKKMNFYRANTNDMGMQKFAELIEQGCQQVKIAVTQLRGMKNIKAITEAMIKINSIENQADDIFDMSIERLFAMETDAKEVIKIREIYQVMELATDKCEDASKDRKSVV